MFSPGKAGGNEIQPELRAGKPLIGQRRNSTASGKLRPRRLQRLSQPSDRGRLRLYLLQPRLNFIEVDHTIPVINDHVPVKVNPAADERNISGGQPARHNFMWLRAPGERRG